MKNQAVPSIDFTIFRSNLKKLRAIHNITSNDLSKKLELRGVKRIADLEGEGRGTPSLEEVIRIAKYCNVTIDDLLFKELKIKISYE